jgi:hypothetical protein
MNLVYRKYLIGLATLGVSMVGLLLAGATAVAASPPEAPVSESASGVTGSTAMLHGTLNPNEKTTAGWYFAYSTEATCTLNGYTNGLQPEEEVLAQKEQAEISGLEPNKQYSFCLVAENAAQETTEGSSLTFTTEKVVPAIGSENASGVSSMDAQLEATINPENEETTYYFQYATEANGEQLIDPQTVIGGTLPTGHGVQPVGPVDIGGGLGAGEIYYYRVIAENTTHEKSEGPVQSFQTTSTPLVSGEEAQNPTGTRVLLSASLNTVGLETRYHFAYINQTGYETALTNGSTDPYAGGSGTPEEIMGADYGLQTVGPVFLSELAPGTTYHYALIATNTDGTTIGPDQTFTTTPATAPIITTGPASNIGQDTATLSATINTNGLQTIYGFETGTETGTYGPAAGIGSLGGATTQTITLNLEDLQPGTTYHYRITATNLDGTTHGADATFTTASFPTLVNVPPSPQLINTPLFTFPTTTQPTTTGKTETKKLTNTQKLAAALKTCKKDKPKTKRTTCEKQARKHYTPTQKKK